MRPVVGREISGKTLGIVGMGAIGELLARYARAVGMSVLAYDVVTDERTAAAYGVEYAALDRLLRTADYVSLARTLRVFLGEQR